MASRSVWTETFRVECLAKVGFVFRVARDIFKFADSVRELTLLAVFALALKFLKFIVVRKTQYSFEVQLDFDGFYIIS